MLTPPGEIVGSDGRPAPTFPSLVAALADQKRSGYLGMGKKGPRFAESEASVGIFGGDARQRGERVLIPTVATHPGAAVVVTRNRRLRDETIAARRVLAADQGDAVMEWTLGSRANPHAKEVVVDAGPFAHGGVADMVGRWVHKRFFALSANDAHGMRGTQAQQLLKGVLAAAALGRIPVTRVYEDLEMDDLRLYREVLNNVLEEQSGADAGERFDAQIALGHLDFVDRFDNVESGGPSLALERALPASFSGRARHLALQALAPFASPAARSAAESVPRPDLEAFVRGNGTLYITVDRDVEDESALVVDALQELMEIQAEHHLEARLSAPLLLVIDDAPALTPTPRLSHWMNQAYKDNVQVIAGFDHRHDVERVWGVDGSHELLTSDCHIAVSLGGFGHNMDFDYWGDHLAAPLESGQKPTGAMVAEPPEGTAFVATHNEGMDFTSLPEHAKNPYMSAILNDAQQTFERTLAAGDRSVGD